MATANPMARRTIHLDRRRQAIEGFGICEAFRQATNIRALPEAARAEVLELLFSCDRGAGFSILRNIIGDGGTWGDRLDGPIPTIEPAKGQWSWTGDEDQIWLTREAFSRGCRKVLASAWSPPAWMKSNDSVANGGYLLEESYGAYAEYLSRYVREYKERHDIEVFAISPANEPDLSTPYSSCLWTGHQLATFIAEHLGPVFHRDRVPSKIVMPETEHFGSVRLSYYAPALERRSAASQIAIIAQHGYGGRVEAPPGAREAGKAVWLTEISDARKEGNDPSIADGIRWARIVHDYLVNAEVNAWCYFWGASTHHQGPISLLGIVDGEGRIVRSKRLFTIGNFSRFIRPGFQRLDVTAQDEDGLRVSAYIDGDGDRIVVVAINEQADAMTLCLQMDGLPGHVLRGYRTSADEELSPTDVVRPHADRLTSILPGMSVTSFIGSASGSSWADEGSVQEGA